MKTRLQTAAFYVGYGSNLNLDDLDAWCQSHGFEKGFLEPLDVVEILDRTLAFTRRSKARQGGVLDLLPRLGAVTRGVRFRVRGNGWELLARKEGPPYERVPVTVRTSNGEVTQVDTFTVRPSERSAEKAADGSPYVRPTASYLGVVRRGYLTQGLPLDGLEAAAAGQPDGAIVGKGRV